MMTAVTCYKCGGKLKLVGTSKMKSVATVSKEDYLYDFSEPKTTEKIIDYSYVCLDKEHCGIRQRSLKRINV